MANGYQKRVGQKQVEGRQNAESLLEQLDDIGIGKPYIFIQEIESAMWQVTHSLGFKYPAVRIIDNEGNIIIANVNYITDNYLEIDFTDPTAGIAYIRN